LRKRLFVDIDGVLAVFNHVSDMSLLYREGYFSSLLPQANVVEAVKIIFHSKTDIEIYTLSAYLNDSPFAFAEKNIWLDSHLPEVASDKRVFVPYGNRKQDYIVGNVSPSDYLLDDFTANLLTWQRSGGIGIKLLNDINNTGGTWAGNKVSFAKPSMKIACSIIYIMDGESVCDDNPKRRDMSPIIR